MLSKDNILKQSTRLKKCFPTLTKNSERQIFLGTSWYFRLRSHIWKRGGLRKLLSQQKKQSIVGSKDAQQRLLTAVSLHLRAKTNQNQSGKDASRPKWSFTDTRHLAWAMLIWAALSRPTITWRLPMKTLKITKIQSAWTTLFCCCETGLISTSRREIWRGRVSAQTWQKSWSEGFLLDSPLYYSVVTLR